MRVRGYYVNVAVALLAILRGVDVLYIHVIAASKPSEVFGALVGIVLGSLLVVLVLSYLWLGIRGSLEFGYQKVKGAI